jgi:protein arginine kinase activator
MAMIFNKPCSVCGKPATHKFVRMEKHQPPYDMYFCDEHASEKSPYQKPKIPLSEILASFLSQEQSGQSEAGVDLRVRCGSCGLPFEAYRKTLILGCPHCYESFEEQLLPELRRFHGNIKHIGRKPGGGYEAPASAGSPIEIELPEDEAAASVKGEEESREPAAQAEPALVPDPQVELDDLTRQLNAAISSEDFEEAARCRDRIRELKERLGKA